MFNPIDKILWPITHVNSDWVFIVQQGSKINLATLSLSTKNSYTNCISFIHRFENLIIQKMTINESLKRIEHRIHISFSLGTFHRSMFRRINTEYHCFVFIALCYFTTKLTWLTLKLSQPILMLCKFPNTLIVKL